MSDGLVEAVRAVLAEDCGCDDCQAGNYKKLKEALAAHDAAPQTAPGREEFANALDDYAYEYKHGDPESKTCMTARREVFRLYNQRPRERTVDEDDKAECWRAFDDWHSKQMATFEEGYSCPHKQHEELAWRSAWLAARGVRR